MDMTTARGAARVESHGSHSSHGSHGSRGRGRPCTARERREGSGDTHCLWRRPAVRELGRSGPTNAFASKHCVTGTAGLEQASWGAVAGAGKTAGAEEGRTGTSSDRSSGEGTGAEENIRCCPSTTGTSAVAAADGAGGGAARLSLDSDGCV